ncbi:hypothetical protein AWB69_06342 [Caballeronia udeis]|uniref:Uncharacterized protein n=1 Tax=Caballeronia udeis TaxID=1232866 RepID=A0A164D346_9BURK|nr:hypothetical protein [Caballeronia udeis]SAP34785.1 hypothetical protein AWB69_06342 [Caballeronia udeis]
MPQPKTPQHSKPKAPADVSHREAALDEALDESFPASDPVAISVDRNPAPEPKRHDSHGKQTR